MKINPLNDAALAATAPIAAGTAGATASKAESAASGGAAAQAPAAEVSGTVKMSAAARLLELAASSKGTGIDGAKVAAFRAAIAAGTFRVDSSAIADKLLSNAQEVLSRARRES